MQNYCIDEETDVDVDRARTFLEIVHTGSFLKAADRLHVTQTTVSARIRTLEESLGKRLFVRSRNGVTLTAAGRVPIPTKPPLCSDLIAPPDSEMISPPGAGAWLAV